MSEPLGAIFLLLMAILILAFMGYSLDRASKGK